ncbi:hypothetical protein PRK78_004528 [Emydomyces testavorans]|uniref:PD-(D/E)XK nuclease-like domain-containing protein n=1 Tax=Emydomyces testavorans TaxID=2070801 RepID=A0AAF0DLP1_9EURO|nr:hypothetical protein PRK78_004528 [Emydomyces testavorans]
MKPKLEDEKFQFIEQWLEGVSAETSVTTQGATKRQRRQQQQQQQQQHLQPAHSFDIQPSTINSRRVEQSKKMAGKKRAQPPQADAPPAAKRRATPTSRRGTRGRQPIATTSVHFPEAETQAEGSYTTHHSHSASISTRRQREVLGFARPRVHFLPLESKNKPDAVTKLFSELIDRLEDAVPHTLRAQVKTLENGGSVRVRDVGKEDAQLWTHIRDSTSKANKTLAIIRDESGWINVARPLLEVAMSSGNGDLFEVMDVTTVSVGPASLIPVFRGEPVAFKKVDFAIVFSGDEPELGRLYTRVTQRHDAVQLSQTEDPGIGHFCQFAAIEVKSPDGSYYGASVQLAIWLAAGLEKTRQLKELATASETAPTTTETPLLPYVGIAVVGHVWNLHLASKTADGTVEIYGPLVMGDATTTRGTFRIVAALNHIRAWGESTYYPWLMNEILLPLAGETEFEAAGALAAGPEQDVGEHETAETEGKGKERV